MSELLGNVAIVNFLEDVLALLDGAFENIELLSLLIEDSLVFLVVFLLDFLSGVPIHQKQVLLFLVGRLHDFGKGKFRF